WHSVATRHSQKRALPNVGSLQGMPCRCDATPISRDR
ncbi:MAG: hypothetical protein ACI85K_001014, partial [Hyphomicrobiaceae bacterium]